MEKLFKLKQNGTTVKTEILAGITTFLTMSYIVMLNPNLLTSFDVGSELWNGVFVATCLASAVGTACMAFFANLPFAMAPGMGINTFFAIVATNIATITGVSYLASFQTALCITLIEGIVFLVLSLISVREKIVDAIPKGIRLGISPALGMMLLYIGFGSNAFIYDDQGNSYGVLQSFFGALSPSTLKSEMGNEYPVMIITVITMMFGFFLIVILNHKKIRGAVLLGVLASAALYWACSAVFLGTNPFASLEGASFVPPFGDMINTTLFKFNFSNLADVGWLTVVTLVITFCIIDMFDTIGTLIGTASKAGMINEKGEIPKIKEALTVDAVGTIVGATTGTSTVTTFVESASGVESGGRTGLTALTTAVMFLACIFIAPFVAVIPPAATSAALIYVGISMVITIKNIDFSEITEYVPMVIMLIAMPISESIGNAIGLALISYVVIALTTGKRKEIHALTWILSVVFLVKFFVTI